MDFLNKEQTTAIKGILCIIVLLAHSCGPLYIRYFGAWAVACFFFLSGFSMELTTANKEIAGRFILRRILLLIVPMILVELLYHPLFSIIGMNLDLNTFAGYVTGVLTFAPPINVAWYIEILVLFSVVFMTLRKCFKTDFIRTSVFFILFYLLLLVYTFLCTPNSFVMKTAIWFYFGAFYSHNRKAIEEKFGGKTWLKYLLIAIALIAFVLPWLSARVEYPLSGALIVLFDNTAPLLVFGLASIIDLRNKVFLWLGKLSIWIYLLHYGVVTFCGFVLRNIEPFNKIPALLSVFVLTLSMAYLYEKIYSNTFLKLINKLK